MPNQNPLTPEHTKKCNICRNDHEIFDLQFFLPTINGKKQEILVCKSCIEEILLTGVVVRGKQKHFLCHNCGTPKKIFELKWFKVWLNDKKYRVFICEDCVEHKPKTDQGVVHILASTYPGIKEKALPNL